MITVQAATLTAFGASQLAFQKPIHYQALFAWILLDLNWLEMQLELLACVITWREQNIFYSGRGVVSNLYKLTE